MNNMYRIALFLVLFLFAQDINAQSEPETGSRVLTLPDVIQLARDQSLMGLMARHQFRSSYWEYRTHIARYRPGLSLEATFPSLNNVMESVTQPDGSEKFVSTSNMQTGLDLQLNQNIGLTGGRVFVTSQIQRNDNFNEEPPKMIDLYLNTGAQHTKTHITYRYQFDREKPFKRFMEEVVDLAHLPTEALIST